MKPLILNEIPQDDAGRIGVMVRQLAVNPAPFALIDWIESERRRLDAKLRQERDEVQCRRLQGATLALEDILTELERVSEVQRPWNARNNKPDTANADRT